MQILIIGFLLALGWGLGGLVIDIVSEITFEQLHKSQRYMKICGRETKEHPTINKRIGF